MNCKYSNLLSSYMDGNLDTGNREKVCRHLSACSECRRELESIERLNAFLSDSCASLEPDEDFTRVVMAMTRTVPSPAEKIAAADKRYGFAKRIAVFAALSLGYIIYAIFSFGRPGTTTSVNPVMQAFYLVNILVAVSGFFMFFCCREAVSIDSWIARKIIRKYIPVTVKDYSVMQVCGIAFIGAVILLPFVVSF